MQRIGSICVYLPSSKNAKMKNNQFPNFLQKNYSEMSCSCITLEILKCALFFNWLLLTKDNNVYLTTILFNIIFLLNLVDEKGEYF